MSKNTEDFAMGLPRGSGKRQWPDDEGEREGNPPKVLCTSPPHALCAEDILKHHPNPPDQAAEAQSYECEITTTTTLALTGLKEKGIDDIEGCYDMPLDAKLHPTTTDVGDCDADPLSDNTVDPDEEEENFIDDEEDKDSGFIDGNSIDNSSDDDLDMIKECPTSSGVSLMSESAVSRIGERTKKEKADVNLQLSLSKVLPVSSNSMDDSPSLVSLVTTFTTSVTVTSSIGQLDTSTTASLQFSGSIASKCNEIKPRTASVTTVTSAQTGTVVTSAYQGSVPSPSYDLHNYHPSYSAEMYVSRSATPSWSCNFPEGSHSTPNKYMEISPTRSHTNQSIQCDENGKSYLELGSASPYTNTYTPECGSFTTSPSTYNANLQSPSFTGSQTYGQGNNYFNSRQTYSSNSYGYHSSESYNQYDGEGCSYNYPNASYQTSPAGRPMILRGAQRCTSPLCDPTRSSPRPSCYPQQRLSVLNMSMYKLNRYSRFPEPSLHRSVLIWNTLRHIERELESEGVSMSSILSQSHHYGPHNALHGVGANTSETMPSLNSTSQFNEGPLPPMHSPLVGSSGHHSPGPPSLPPSVDNPSSLSPQYNTGPSLNYPSPPQYPSTSEPTNSFEAKDIPSSNCNSLPLRPYPTPQTPLPQIHSPHERISVGSCPIEPMTTESEDVLYTNSQGTQPPRTSTITTEERSEDINWCSVLSLSSQTDLDSMNNNECHEWSNDAPSGSNYTSRDESSSTSWKLPSLSPDDVLKSFPESSRRSESSEDLDSIIKVLVGS